LFSLLKKVVNAIVKYTNNCIQNKYNKYNKANKNSTQYIEIIK
jgi:hypothetical protein